MRVIFRDDRLSLICTDRPFELGLSIGVIQSARRKLLLLEDATDERTLRNWKSLNYKKLSGVREGQRSVRINDQYRIVFTLDTEQNPPVVTIIEIGDTH